MRHAIAAPEFGPNPPILPYDLNEVWWASGAFFVVVGILVWKAGPPIKRAWNGRIERLRAELDVAGSAREEAETDLTELRTRVANIDAERARIRAEAEATATAVKAQLRERAEQDAEAIRTRGRADVVSLRAQAEADLRAEVSGLALGAAEQIVVRSLDDTTQRDLIESYISKVGSPS